MPADHPHRRLLELLDEAVRRDVHFIARHPTTLFQCLWNTCWWYDCPEEAAHYESRQHQRRSKLWPNRARFRSFVRNLVDEQDATVTSNDIKSPISEQHGSKAHQVLEELRQRKEMETPGFYWLRSLRPPAQQLGTALKAVFSGHEATVTSVAFSVDGRHVASASLDKTVRLWDVMTGAELRCLRASDFVRSMAFSSDGRRLATGSDRTSVVQLWDVIAGMEIRRFDRHQSSAKQVAFSPDGGKLATSDWSVVRLWDVVTGAEPCCLCPQVYAGDLLSLTFSPDGRKLASAYFSGTIRLWDIDRGSELAILDGHSERGVFSVAFSPDGQHLASGGGDNTVRYWDLATSAEVHCFRGHENYVRSVVVSADGRHLASGSDDLTVRLWDVSTGAEDRCIRAHEGSVNSVTFSPDGRYLASGSGDKTVRLWDITTPAKSYRLRGHETVGDAIMPSFSVQSLSFSPDGRQLAGGSTDKTVRLWDAASGLELRNLCGHGDSVRCTVYSPDGRQLASGSGDKTVRLWNTDTGVESFCLCGNETYVSTAAISHDGRVLASGCGGYPSVRLWDVARGREVRCLLIHAASLAFSPAGRQLAAGGFDFHVRIWDVVEGIELHRLRGHERQVASVAFSPDGRQLASGSWDSTVRVWDVFTGTEVCCLRGHTGEVQGVAFSSDGRRLASRALGRETRLWELATGKCLEVIDGTGDVTSVVQCPSMFPWRALSRSNETVLEEAASRQCAAWFPAVLDEDAAIVAHPSSRLWAGSVSNHVHIVALEGPPPAQKTSSTPPVNTMRYLASLVRKFVISLGWGVGKETE